MLSAKYRNTPTKTVANTLRVQLNERYLVTNSKRECLFFLSKCFLKYTIKITLRIEINVNNVPSTKKLPFNKMNKTIAHIYALSTVSIPSAQNAIFDLFAL